MHTPGCCCFARAVVALRQRGRLLVSAVVLCLAGLSPAVAVAQTAAPAPLRVEGDFSDDDPRDHPAVQRMFRSVALLMLAGLLIMAFAIGAYLVIRVGRAVAQKSRSPKQTEYVDAWGQYRLSEAEIEAALRNIESRDSETPPPGGASSDGPPEPPRQT